MKVTKAQLKSLIESLVKKRLLEQTQESGEASKFSEACAKMAEDIKSDPERIANHFERVIKAEWTKPEYEQAMENIEKARKLFLTASELTRVHGDSSKARSAIMNSTNPIVHMLKDKVLMAAPEESVAPAELDEKSPPGWGGTVKAMKKHKDISNPFALAWSMKNKGEKSHIKDDRKDEVFSSDGYEDEGAAITEALYEEHIGFKNLVKKLKDQGKSEESAKKIAYSIGVKKYGKGKMAKAAAKHKPLSDKQAKK